MVLPTLWSGPWIWREQDHALQETGLFVAYIPEAVVNWPVEPTLDALDVYCLEQIASLPPPHILLGASLGGLLALRLARRRPDLALGVIASGCPGLGRAPGLGLGGRRAFSFEEALRIRAMLFRDPTCVDDDLLRLSMAAVTGRPAAQRGVRLLSQLRAYDPCADLAAFEVPIALVWGAEDALSPPEPWRLFASSRPGIEFHEIPRAGHVPMLETPQAFNILLRTLVGRMAKATSHE